MGQQSEFEKNCERYLLGELSEAEQEQFEEAYFADDALFEQFEAVKDEMLDAYARGELAEEKQARFAAHFLAAAPRRRQLDETQEFIRALTAVSTKTVTPGKAAVSAPVSTTTSESSWRRSFKIFFNPRQFAWQAAFAAVLLAALAGIWIFVRNSQPPAAPDEQAAVQPTPLPATPLPPPAPISVNDNREIANSNAAPPPPPSPMPVNVNKPPANVNQLPVNMTPTPPAAPKKPPARPIRNRQPESAKIPVPENDRKNTPFALTLSTVGRDPGKTASISLSPVASRDINDENTLEIFPATRSARVRLVFKNDDYRSFSARITTVEGANVWQTKRLKAALDNGEKSVTLQFPSVLLTKQDYIVTLKGITSGGQTETIGEYYFRVERTQAPKTIPDNQP